MRRIWIRVRSEPHTSVERARTARPLCHIIILLQGTWWRHVRYMTTDANQLGLPAPTENCVLEYSPSYQMNVYSSKTVTLILICKTITKLGFCVLTSTKFYRRNDDCSFLPSFNHTWRHWWRNAVSNDYCRAIEKTIKHFEWNMKTRSGINLFRAWLRNIIMELLYIIIFYAQSNRAVKNYWTTGLFFFNSNDELEYSAQP